MSLKNKAFCENSIFGRGIGSNANFAKVQRVNITQRKPLEELKVVAANHQEDGGKRIPDYYELKLREIREIKNNESKLIELSDLFET